MSFRSALLGFGLAALVGGYAGSGRADENLAGDINETVVKLPATVRDADGRTISKDILVTQFKPQGEGPFSIVVINHGRIPNDRSRPPRYRYLQQARYFVRRGFMVLVPTRIGYGAVGVMPDPENAGGCNVGNFSPGLTAAAAEITAVIAYARHQPFVDPTRVLIVGESYGGLATIAVAAGNPDGVLAAINFSGGSGGNAIAHAGAPCQASKLERLFADYGKQTRVPTLWVYSENDKFFPPAYARAWFAAFRAAGGIGELRLLQAYGENGHRLFDFGFSIWRPLIDQFLHQRGVPVPKSIGGPKPSGYARLEDSDRVPLITREDKRDAYTRFLQLDVPRAFAIGPKGEYSYRSAPDAMQRALEKCKARAKADCRLYAVDDDVVW